MGMGMGMGSVDMYLLQERMHGLWVGVPSPVSPV